MLLDINVYVGHWPFKQLQSNTCEKLLERMDRFGVDVSIVSNLNGIFYKNTQSANEELYNELASDNRFRDRFVPFAVINPIYAGWREDLKTCVDMGMKGVRLYPKYHDYMPSDPSCIKLVERLRDLGLPVALTIRMVDSRQRSWMDTEEEWELKDIVPLVKAVPDARYIVLNLANSLSLDNEDEILIKRSKILFDTSGRELSDLGNALKRFGKEKFAFGTHFPILDSLTALLRIESLTPDEADEETKEMLRSGNAKEFLDL